MGCIAGYPIYAVREEKLHDEESVFNTCTHPNKKTLERCRGNFNREYGMLNPQRGLLSFEHSISPLLGFCEKTNCLHIKKNSKVKREHHSEVGAVVTEVLMHS